MFTQTPVQYFVCKMMLLINLHPVKYSYVQVLCEANFAPILEFAIFHYFKHNNLEKSYIFLEFLVISSLECMSF